jgi:hypothetical protein
VSQNEAIAFGIPTMHRPEKLSAEFDLIIAD